MKISPNDLLIPDPDSLDENIEKEMRQQIDHNLKSGIIKVTNDGFFRYSKRGILFLWCQFIKDMIRLC
jgi:hypothetical protein